MYVYTVYIYIYEWIRALLYMFEEYVYIPHVSPDFWGLLKEPPIKIPSIDSAIEKGFPIGNPLSKCRYQQIQVYYLSYLMSFYSIKKQHIKSPQITIVFVVKISNIF